MGISPASGPVSGGQKVVISGSNLGSATKVTFAALDAPITQRTPQSLAVTTPASQIAGDVNVTVWTPSGKVTSKFRYVAPPAPVITSVSPSGVSSRSVSEVTLTGTDLLSTREVTVDAQKVSVISVADTRVRIRVGPSGPGAHPVLLTTAGGSARATIMYLQPPEVTSMSPRSGPVQGGTRVTLTGSGLRSVTEVRLQGDPSPSLIIGQLNDSLTFVTNSFVSSGITSARVTLSGPLGDLSAGSFEFIPPPVITSAAPQVISSEGNTEVTLTGSHLMGARNVTVNGQLATVYSVADQTVRMRAPLGIPGPARIELTTPSGTATTTVTYMRRPEVTNMRPISGPIQGGTRVTLTGRGLNNVTEVRLQGDPSPSRIVEQSSDSLIFVTNSFEALGVDRAALDLSTPVGTWPYSRYFSPIPRPALKSVSPEVIRTAGSVSLILSGVNLQETQKVTVNGTSATVEYAAPFNARVIAPPGTPGPARIEVTTSSGTATASVTYMQPVEVSNMRPTSGPLQGGTRVTVTGRGLQNVTAVRLDPDPSSLRIVDQTEDSLTFVTNSSEANGRGRGYLTLVSPLETVTPTPFRAFEAIPPPVLTGASPEVVPSPDAAELTLSGRNLVATTSVTVNGKAADIRDVTDNKVRAYVWGILPGSARIELTTTSGSATTSVTYMQKPRVTQMSPQRGPAAGGTEVTLTGTGLADVTQVRLAGVVAPSRILKKTDTSLTFVTEGLQAAASTRAAVTLINALGAFTTGESFSIGPLSRITSLRPERGSDQGGTTVTVEGEALEGLTAIKFGDQVLTPQRRDQSWVFQTPDVTRNSQLRGGGRVQVSALVGSDETNALPFTYQQREPTITEIRPAVGPRSGGITALIVGTQLDLVTGVTVNGVDAPITWLGGIYVPPETATSTDSGFRGLLHVTLPPSSVSGPVPVTLLRKGLPSATSTFRYLNEDPYLTSVSNQYVYGPGSSSLLEGYQLSQVLAVAVGSDIIPVTPMSDTAIQVPLPDPIRALVDTTVPISLMTEEGAVATPFTITYPKVVPVVTSIWPLSGVADGGTPIVIRGQNLDVLTKITFSGALTEPLTANGRDYAIARSPRFNAGSYRPPPGVTWYDSALSVSGPGLLNDIPTGFTFRYILARPSVSAASPTRGPETGGTIITLTGDNLADVVAAGPEFSGGLAFPLERISRDNEVSFALPPLRAGIDPRILPPLTQEIVIVTPNERIRTGFSITYVESDPDVTSVAPVKGPMAGGTEVTITGRNLGRMRGVVFGSEGPGTIVTSTETRIVVRSPAHAASDEDVDEPISLRLAAADGSGATRSFATGANFTYEVPDPVIRGISPDEGPLAGGTSVVITGRNLDQVTSVTFGSRSARIESQTATRIEVTSPAAANPGAVRITVRSASGSDREPGGFTYLSPPSPTPTPTPKPSPSDNDPSPKPSSRPSGSPSPSDSQPKPQDDDDRIDVSGFSPSSGPMSGGTAVTITGTKLNLVTGVRFGGQAATIQSKSAGSLVVIAPAAEGTYSVNVIVEHSKGAIEAGSYTYTS